MENTKQEKVCSAVLDYQPDAVELALRPLPWWAQCGVWAALICFVGAIVAAHFCRVDVIVTGHGKVISSLPNIAMKPLERSVVKEVCVTVGQVVEKGDVLFWFDPEINEAEVERLTNECNSLQAQYQRWEVEFKEGEWPAIDNPTSDQEWQETLFHQRRAFYEEKMNAYASSLNRLKASIKTKQDALVSQGEIYAKQKQILDNYESLGEKNAVAANEILQVQMQSLQQESNITSLKNSIVEAEAELEEMTASRQSFIMDWQQDISQNMVKVRRELLGTQAQLDKAKRILEYDCLRAPCDAVVHEVASFPVGSAVREAEELITLVPINCDVELEAEIPAKDIGRIEMTDPVRVKLTAFPFQRHGTLEGTLRVISEDAFRRNVAQMTSQDQEQPGAFYRARITLAGKLRNVPDKFRLIPGMEAQVEIKTGTRSVLEYILHPLTKALDEAAREP